MPLLMEGLALTGAWVDKARGLISLIALELGVSSRLVAYLKEGEPVVLMGPTGAPTEIPERQQVLLLGGGLGNAVLFSIAKALHERGNRVLYVAGYKRGEDLFKREDIEAATDQVVWSTDTGASIVPTRPQDAHYRGNIVQALLAYQRGELGERLVPLPTVDRIIAIGSDRMMAAVTAARHGVLAPYLKNDHVGIVSINSPMQCMMKEVCAQCLQSTSIPRPARRRSSSPASTRIRRWIASIFRTLPHGCGRTPCRRNSRTCGWISCWMVRTCRTSDSNGRYHREVGTARPRVTNDGRLTAEIPSASRRFRRAVKGFPARSCAMAANRPQLPGFAFALSRGVCSQRRVTCEGCSRSSSE